MEHCYIIVCDVMSSGIAGFSLVVIRCCHQAR